MAYRGNNKKEDEILKNQVEKYDQPNWESIAESLQFKGFSKSSKQCRER